MGITSENRAFRNQEKFVFDCFLIKIIGKRYQTWSKTIRFVTKADFCGIFELCKMISLLKNNVFIIFISHKRHYVNFSETKN